ncbi:hypothetical protein V6N13_083794 [Hibiscus sabdariffa]|uniref:Uncharacterized protein n=1 Tax=Hibiscus sabdariffa TaxID=183260 RepID=A0ABR2SZ32_9ROSI
MSRLITLSSNMRKGDDNFLITVNESPSTCIVRKPKSMAKLMAASQALASAIKTLSIALCAIAQAAMMDPGGDHTSWAVDIEGEQRAAIESNSAM